MVVKKKLVKVKKDSEMAEVKKAVSNKNEKRFPKLRVLPPMPKNKVEGRASPPSSSRPPAPKREKGVKEEIAAPLFPKEKKVIKKEKRKVISDVRKEVGKKSENKLVGKKGKKREISKEGKKVMKKEKRKLSKYNMFVKQQMDSGKTMAEAAKAWKRHKSGVKKVIGKTTTRSVGKGIKKEDAKETEKTKVISPIARRIRTEKDIAMDFAGKVQQKFDRLVKASILFGSQTVAKGGATTGSDIDIILIVDDVSTNWDLELVAWYREELGKLVARQKYGGDLHINTVRLSTWWEDLLHGDPVVINILRYGEALIDYGGFFNPIKALLQRGKIRSTPEAVHAALRRAPGHLARSRAAEMAAIEGVYWAMVDSAQAALMTSGKMPPSPEYIPEMLKEVFVDAGMLKMSHVKGLSELYNLHKSISHGRVSDIKGQEIDEWQEMAEKFMLEMTRIIDGLLESQKKE